MATRDRRRHPRFAYVGPVRLAWESPSGETHYVQAKCLDISTTGMRVELSLAAPIGTQVLLNAEQIKVSGTARVKEAVRHGSKYILGLELNDKIRREFLSKRDEGSGESATS